MYSEGLGVRGGEGRGGGGERERERERVSITWAAQYVCTVEGRRDRKGWWW